MRVDVQVAERVIIHCRPKLMPQAQVAHGACLGLRKRFRAAIALVARIGGRSEIIGIPELHGAVVAVEIYAE